MKSLATSPDVSRILQMDESLMSGIGNIGSLIGSTPALDMKQIEKNLNDDPTKEVKVIDLEEPGSALAAPKKIIGGGTTPGGARVKGWQERLAKLREQKEQEKKNFEESKVEQSADSSQDPTLDKIKDVFAPA